MFDVLRGGSRVPFGKEELKGLVSRGAALTGGGAMESKPITITQPPTPEAIALFSGF